MALIAGMVGCAGVKYDLTIASTEGGEVTRPREGTFRCNKGKVVDLEATPDAGCRFVNWTGDVDDIANVEDATTTITMNVDYSITANFELAILKIWNWDDLDAIRNNLGGNYLLMDNLDSTTAGYNETASNTANGEDGWRPIGTSGTPFTGSFDGQDHEIRDLFITRSDEDYVGLFGYVDGKGVVQNVTVVNADVTGHENVGGMVGANSGTVSNSYSTGSVTGEGFFVGGLAGANSGTVSNSYSSSSVTGEEGVGGLVGFNEEGTVSNSYSTGSVTGEKGIGGLAGGNAGTVNNSYSSGNVNGEEFVGGLVGGNAGTVSNSYSTASVSGSAYAGGLVGGGVGTASTSFWDTETSGQVTSDGGTGKTTAEMQDIGTFSGAVWNIIAVNPGVTDPTYTWNIVDDETYPFLSWQS